MILTDMSKVLCGRHRYRKLLQVACCMTVGLPIGNVSAQDLRGRIVGAVTDSSNAVLPGVTVTVSGSALIHPFMTTTSDEGTYAIPGLPSGKYNVTFELARFQPLRHENIKLNLNTTLAVDAKLMPAGVETSVSVTSESPVVDVKTTAINTSFDSMLLAGLPSARDIWSVIAQAPGFQVRGYDVGGSKSGNQTAYAAYGVESSSRTLFEGIITNNTRTSIVKGKLWFYGSCRWAAR
jgi:hypothetical protein